MFLIPGGMNWTYIKYFLPGLESKRSPDHDRNSYYDQRRS